MKNTELNIAFYIPEWIKLTVLVGIILVFA